MLRPNQSVKDNIQKLLAKLKQIEPNQYFYPTTDIHITVMSIISCYDGFNLSHINVNDYVEIINESLIGINSFEVIFRGLTASPSCIMAQGFLENDLLNQLRANLRTHFQVTSLEQSIDKRYTIHTAHATILRLKEELKNKGDFIDIIEAYRDHTFGAFKVDSLELVFNDWYQRSECVKVLHQFELK